MFVTKLVPQLKPHESCVDVPKEVCVRSQTNPRKVQKPVIKKRCYTPSEESGLGVLASTAESDSDVLAQPAAQQCPARCRKAIRSGDCDPSCASYGTVCGPCVQKTTPAPPQCPLRCRDAIRTGNCDPTCTAYNSICGECIPKYNPPPKTTPPPPPQCPSKCRAAIKRGVCDPSCNTYNSVCGPCVPKTTPPPPQCPAKCRNAIQTGNCDSSCNSFSYVCGRCVPKTTPPPPQCPSKCKNAIKQSELGNVTPHATDTTPYVGGAPPPHPNLCRVGTSLLPLRAAGASLPSLGTVFSSSHVTSLLGRPLGK